MQEVAWEHTAALRATIVNAFTGKRVRVDDYNALLQSRIMRAHAQTEAWVQAAAKRLPHDPTEAEIDHRYAEYLRSCERSAQGQ